MSAVGNFLISFYNSINHAIKELMDPKMDSGMQPIERKVEKFSVQKLAGCTFGEFIAIFDASLAMLTSWINCQPLDQTVKFFQYFYRLISSYLRFSPICVCSNLKFYGRQCLICMQCLYQFCMPSTCSSCSSALLRLPMKSAIFSISHFKKILLRRTFAHFLARPILQLSLRLFPMCQANTARNMPNNF